MLRSNVNTTETIYARSTGALPSAVAIVRIAGPIAFSVAAKLFSSPLPYERGMHFGFLKDDLDRVIDKPLLLSFVRPHSFTGEDVIEFHCHGSVAIIRKLERELEKLGVRPAHPGEFSYRAFLNGKLSALELENLGDLFQASAAGEIAEIYDRREGSLKALVERLRSWLIQLQAILDTAVDFTEEYPSVVTQAKEPLQSAIQVGDSIIQRYQAFREVSNHPKIVLAGSPNAGKSSLFNALLCRQKAITHEQAGTTRDLVEADLEIGDRLFRLVDTAGIRDVASGPERQGIQLAEEALSECTLWILVIDGTKGLGTLENQLLEQWQSKPCLIVWNKNDLEHCLSAPPTLGAVAISALSGVGIARIWALLEKRLLSRPEKEIPLATASQVGRLRSVNEMLKLVGEELNQGVPAEVMAEKVRQSLGMLEQMIGVVDHEMVLDRVFNEFCIGK